jgi:hypothetical protein
VSFHETGFLGKLNQESGAPFWFQLGNKQRQQLGSPFGPVNPQALNRYSYVQNNPVKYTDPSGHSVYLSAAEAQASHNLLKQGAQEIRDFVVSLRQVAAGGELTEALIVLLTALSARYPMLAPIAAMILSGSLVLSEAADLLDGVAIQMSNYADALREASNDFTDEVIVHSACAWRLLTCLVSVYNRRTGEAWSGEVGGSVISKSMWDISFGAYTTGYYEGGRACTAQGGNPTGSAFLEGDTHYCDGTRINRNHLPIVR